jgi:hypothetical protein
MAITTNNSMSVKPHRQDRLLFPEEAWNEEAKG